jgi:DNA/RNA-binding domain of Phe-tRNA-synthetase-like protein
MIKISQTLTNLYNDIQLAVIEADLDVCKSKSDFIDEFLKFENEFKENHKIEEIVKIPAIANTRKAYRAFGKQPARYRVSSEAMLRRIIQGKGLYYINNVVDINNYVSTKYGYGICCFDKSKIQGNKIEFCLAPEGESYKGIGKAEINISKLPVFKDKLGYFGRPTSDSQRTMISNETKSILFIIVGFDKSDSLMQAIDFAEDCLRKFTNAKLSKKYLV